jgi:hypothetical protein
MRERSRGDDASGAGVSSPAGDEVIAALAKEREQFLALPVRPMDGLIHLGMGQRASGHRSRRRSTPVPTGVEARRDGLGEPSGRPPDLLTS